MRYPCLTGLDVLDLEVTLVGNDVDRLNAEDLLRRFGSLGQQPHIEHLVGDLLLDDQFVLGINGDLRVVADRDTRVGRHRSTIGVCDPFLCRGKAIEGLSAIGAYSGVGAGCAMLLRRAWTGGAL